MSKAKKHNMSIIAMTSLEVVPNAPIVKVKKEELNRTLKNIEQTQKELKEIENSSFLRKIKIAFTGERTDLLTRSAYEIAELAKLNSEMIVSIGCLSEYSIKIQSILLNQQEAIKGQSEIIQSSLEQSEENIDWVIAYVKEIKDSLLRIEQSFNILESTLKSEIENQNKSIASMVQQLNATETCLKDIVQTLERQNYSMKENILQIDGRFSSQLEKLENELENQNKVILKMKITLFLFILVFVFLLLLKSSF